MIIVAFRVVPCVAAFSRTAAVAASCPMTYAQFEAAVPHIDVDVCPRRDLRQDVFCRASVGGEFAHVFFFDKDGEQCLYKMQSYGEDGIELQIKDE